jgi:hypothetical protein
MPATKETGYAQSYQAGECTSKMPGWRDLNAWGSPPDLNNHVSALG